MRCLARIVPRRFCPCHPLPRHLLPQPHFRLRTGQRPSNLRTMRRLTVIVLPLMLLAACGGDSGPAPLPTPSVRARFTPHGLADAIEVEAVDRLALRTAEPGGPDGTTTPSGPIDVNRTERFAAGQVVAND